MCCRFLLSTPREGALSAQLAMLQGWEPCFSPGQRALCSLLTQESPTDSLLWQVSVHTGPLMFQQVQCWPGGVVLDRRYPGQQTWRTEYIFRSECSSQTRRRAAALGEHSPKRHRRWEALRAAGRRPWGWAGGRRRSWRHRDPWPGLGRRRRSEWSTCTASLHTLFSSET